MNIPAVPRQSSAELAAEDLFHIVNLRKIYQTLAGEEVLALNDISLRVRAGEFVSVIGPSGCGKSTLLKILTGLESPSSGRILVSGQEKPLPRDEMGVVFQDPTLLPWRTVLQNVLLNADIAGLKQAEYKDKALHLLDLVGLSGFANKYPSELSGGMKQRAAICRALLRSPKVLFMDEPFGALDALTRDQMALELQAIWMSQRSTVIFITHSISEAVLLSDRVVVMSGRPSRISADIHIELERPRTLDMINREEFGKYASHARGLLSV